jgi:EF hand
MKSALMLTTAAVIFACGTIAATAQDAPVMVTPGYSTQQQDQEGKEQQNQRTQDGDQQTVGQGMRERMQEGAQGEEDEDHTNAQGYRGGMMGWPGRGMMGRDEGPGWMQHHRGWGQREGGGPGMMGGGMAARIIFSLMDADGDGKLSLEEFRAAHDRIFKAMDTDKDGTVTMQEMMGFMRGTARPAQQP